MTLRPRRRQLYPGYVVSVSLAQALSKRDPKFLAVLKASVWDLQKSLPSGDDASETLQIFSEALNDPSLFPFDDSRTPETLVVTKPKTE